MKHILLHGFCEDSRIWEPMLQKVKIASDYQVIDLPGFGTNHAETDAAGSIDAMADFVREQIIQFTKEPVILTGHSLGGYVALSLADRFPEMLGGLGLFHSTSRPDSEDRKQARLKTIEFIEKNGAEAYHRVLFPSLFRSGADPDLIQQIITIAQSARKEGILAAIHAMRNRPDRTPVLGDLKSPVLLIAGREDALIPVETTFELASHCAVAQVEVLEHSGHMGQVEEPEKSALILDAFGGLCESLSV